MRFKIRKCILKYYINIENNNGTENNVKFNNLAFMKIYTK